MAAETITAREAWRDNPGAMCCNCGDGAKDAPDEEIWVIWNGRKLYCPDCARQHGIDP